MSNSDSRPRAQIALFPAEATKPRFASVGDALIANINILALLIKAGSTSTQPQTTTKTDAARNGAVNG